MQKIKNLLTKIAIEHSHLRAVFMLLCANFFNNFLTFIVDLILAKKLGPESFGIFSLAASVMMVANMIVDLGFNLTMVRYYNLYTSDRKEQDRLMSSLLIVRFILVLLCLALSLPIGLLLTRGLKVVGSYAFLFPLAIISGGILSLWMYLQNFMQAHRQFSKLSLYIIFYGLTRIAVFLCVYVIIFKRITPTLAIGSLYTLPAFVITIIGLIPIIRYFAINGFPALSVVKAISKQALKYSKWVAISGICYGFLYRVVQFVMASLSTSQELGVFSAGFIFTVAFTTLNVALKTVFFPHITGLEKITDIRKHISRLRKIFPYYVLLVIGGVAILSLIQFLFLDKRYAHALPVFWISSAALASTMFMGLISMLLHTLMHPEIDAVVNIIRFLAAGILTYLLVPVWGAVGGAIAYSAVLIFGEVYLVLKVRSLLRSII